MNLRRSKFKMLTSIFKSLEIQYSLLSFTQKVPIKVTTSRELEQISSQTPHASTAIHQQFKYSHYIKHHMIK